MKIVEFAKHVDPDEVTRHESTLFAYLSLNSFYDTAFTKFFFVFQILPTYTFLSVFFFFFVFFLFFFGTIPVSLVVNACIDL